MTRAPSASSEPLAGRFTPDDFAEVLLKVPEGCPVVGGQAVAWWAAKYGISAKAKGSLEPFTSADIDFWGGRADLQELARRLERQAIFPHEYEMTVWVGAIPLNINGEKSMAEFLHTIPGLDTNNPDRASVEQEYSAPSGKRILQFLSPVSMVLAKLHALRHFNQKERHDELHLRASLQASREFIAQLLQQKAVREALWNCERLIEASQLKPNLGLADEYGFDLLSAVPIAEIIQASIDTSLDQTARRKLANFCQVRWPQITETGKRNKKTPRKSQS